MPYKPLYKNCEYCKKRFIAKRPIIRFCSRACTSIKLNSYRYLKEWYQRKEYIVPKLSKIEWSYIAGIIDGEGTVGMAGNCPQLSIYNTAKVLMKWLKNKLNQSRLYEYKKRGETNKGRKYKTLYSIRISQKKGVLALLRKLIPYLKIKKRKSYNMVMRFKK